MNQPIYKLAITLSMLLGQLLNAQSYKIELINDSTINSKIQMEKMEQIQKQLINQIFGG